MTVATAQAQQQDWQPILIDPQGEFRTALEGIQIQLPEQVNSDQLAWLALELDNIDVTQRVQLEQGPFGFVLIFTPVEPLFYGKHELRLVQYAEDNSIDERGIWEFEVKRSGKARESELTSVGSVTGVYRLNESSLDESSDNLALLEPPESSLSGATSLSGRLATNSAQYAFNADVLYDSRGVRLNSEPPPVVTTQLNPVTGQEEVIEKIVRGGKDIDLGEFLLSARSSRTGVKAGHHAIGYDGLVMRSFYRRGLSVDAASASGQFSATGFAFRTEPLEGAVDGFGIGKEEHRTQGITASLTMDREDPDRVKLSALYLDGQGETHGGFSSFGSPGDGAGDAWSIALDTQSADSQLRFHGEYARTDFDVDGDEAEFDVETDSARELILEYAPYRDRKIGEWNSSLELGLQHQQVGRHFQSLANPYQPADLRMNRGFGQLRIGQLGIRVSAGYEQDNLDNLRVLPRLRNKLANFEISYSPQLQTDESGVPQYGSLGQPSYYLGYEYNRRSHNAVPPGNEGFISNQRSRYAYAGAGFQYSNWYWSFNHARSLLDDVDNLFFDQHSHSTDLSLSKQFGERVSLAMQAYYTTTWETPGGSYARSVGNDLSVDTVLIPGRLRGQLNYNRFRDSQVDGSFDFTSEVLGVNLEWHVRPASEKRSAIRLWLRGEQQKFDDAVLTGGDADAYQLFIGVSLDWDASTAGGRP